uniref:Uncharacterized protein MANES_S048800 n=1 Tax=Rhizophora mucronata TaxID=61149 RepID=A0A2P2KU65_RHIMU
MFKFWDSREQETHTHPRDVTSQSCYQTPVASSPNSSYPPTPSGSSSGYSLHKTTGRPQSLSHVSPAEAAGIIALLRDKR